MLRLALAAALGWFATAACADVTAVPSPTWVYPTDSPYQVQAPVWAAVSEWHLNTGPVRQPVGPGEFSTCWSASGACVLLGPPASTWMIVDLKQAPWGVPADAKWAWLSGTPIMTRGSTNVASGFGVIYRTPGDARVTCDVPNYAVQAVADPNSVREGRDVMVPLVNGTYEFCWHIDLPVAAYPVGPTMAWNPYLRGWAK